MKDFALTSRLARRTKEFIEDDTVLDFDTKDEFKRWLLGIMSNDDESMDIMIDFAKRSVDQAQFLDQVGIDKLWEKRKVLLHK